MVAQEVVMAMETAPAIGLGAFLGGVAVSAAAFKSRLNFVSRQNRKLRQANQSLFEGENAWRERAEEAESALESEQKARAKAEEDARHDSLTGLLNKRSFEEEVDSHFALITRHGDRPKGGLIYLDLDNFKQVNDTYGHAKGDEVLKAAAEAMQENTRKEDRLGRIGGEEFAILDTYLDESTAIIVADRLRKAVTEKSGVTVSIGIAFFGDGQTPENTARLADAALYEAKHGGRDRAVIHSSPHA